MASLTRNKVDPEASPPANPGPLVPADSAPERALAEQLMARAREEGIDLVGPDGMLTKVTKSVLEAALGAELTEHLGYEPHDPAGRGSGNSRNGSTTKVVHTDVGPVTIEVPRDRDGSFSPVIVPKHFRRLEGFDEAVVSLYAKGLTTGEIQSHLEEIYGAEVSKDTVSRITDSVNAEATEWQNRPLDSVYPVIFIDAIVVKIRDGAVANRPIYVAMAVTMEGARDVLGLWVGTGGEGAKHWLNVLTELRNRGMNDVFIVCCDGLNGLPESVKSVWPLADVQTCVVHLVRNTLRYTTQNDWNKLTPALRAVYTAPTRDAATERFAEFEEVWGAKYPAVIRLWRNAWDEFVPFLAFPSEIRSLIYTTNAIESLNSQVRRALRSHGHFPSDEAATKLMWLAFRNITAKWKKPSTFWHAAQAQLAIQFEDRFVFND